MDEPARNILKAFERLGSSRLRAADLVMAEPAAAPEAVSASIALLLDEGCLREVGGQYERTEMGRLEAAGPLNLTLLARPGCHLCELALQGLAPVAAKFGTDLRQVDVDTDRKLRERYGNNIPVVFLGHQEVARHRVDPRQLLRDLSKVKQSL
jgi:glutaredoxin